MRTDIFRRERCAGRLRTRSRRPRVELMESRTLLSAVTWTGDAGDDNWDTPDNWSTQSVPGADDNVTIDATATVVHSFAVTDTIESLTTTAPLSITGGTLSIASASTIGGPLSITAGTLTATGDITVSGPLTLTSGTISGSGQVIANGGMTINPGIAGTFMIDGPMVTNPAGQTATLMDGGVEMSDGATFNNLGTFVAQESGGMGQDTGAASSFNNQGTFTKPAGSGDTVFQGMPFNVAGGTVDVQGGELDLMGGGTDTNATFTSDGNAEIDISGAVTLDSASSIGGTGIVALGGFIGGTIDIAGSYDVTGATVDYGGTTTFTGPVSSIGSSLTAQAGTLNFNTPFSGSAGTIGDVSIVSGTVNLGGNALDATTLELADGGALTGTGTITVGGLMTLSDGTISGSGAVNADGGILIEPYDDPLTLDGRTLINAAGQTATWVEDYDFDFVMSDGATFDNLGTFLFQSGGSFVQGTGASSSFNNQGSLTASTNNGVFTFGPGVSFNSAGGTVDLQTGTVLDLQGGGTITGATFTIELGTTLDFDGSTPFSLDRATTFNGTGSLTKDGATTLVIAGSSPSFTGPTEVEGGTLLVDGSLSGSAVSVTASATLGGTGTVGSIASTASTISPGDSPTANGILTAQGNVTLDSGFSIFDVALNGPNVGTDYDQLNVNGSVNLGRSDFSGSLGFTPTTGDTFTIIKSTAPIVDTFNGLPEGATVTIGGVPFTISYAADGGDAVVLTAAVTPTLAATTTAVTSSANASTLGRNVTFTAAVASTASGTPTGTVTFTIDGRAEPPVNLTMVNGVDQATFTTSSLVLGPNAIGAAYGGDTAFASSSATPLTETVNAPPLLATATQVTSSSASSTVGQIVTFTADVTGSGTAAPTGSVVFTIDGQAEPPVPLSVVDGVARATLSVSTLTSGTHTVVASYGGDADDSPSRSSSQIQVVSATTSAPVDTDGPRIVSMKRYGYHMIPTRIVLTFDQALDAVTAEDVKDYRIIGPTGRTIAVKKAVYDPATLTVTLHPVERISIHHSYKLIVDGTAPRGLTNTKGQLLDGANRGSPDSNYRAPLTWRNLVLDPP
jgi:autotransporter-associated beta strand protein